MNLQKAIDMIKDFEKCKLTAYQDGGGVWTIGWGSTGSDISKGVVWTQEYADGRFNAYFNFMALSVRRLITEPISENEMCAVLSLCYNIGIEKFRHSTLLFKLNSKDRPKDIANEILRWNKDGGKAIAGLTRRRLAEHDLFVS